MYIADHDNRRISIFTTDGQFINTFEEQGSSMGQSNGLRGITFDREGYLCVCDFRNNRLVVY